MERVVRLDKAAHKLRGRDRHSRGETDYVSISAGPPGDSAAFVANGDIGAF